MPETEAKIDEMLNSMDRDALLQMLLKKILMQEMKEQKLLKKIEAQQKQMDELQEKLTRMENETKNYEERNPTPRETFSNAPAKFEQRDSLAGGGPPHPLRAPMGAFREEERETPWQWCHRTLGCQEMILKI